MNWMRYSRILLINELKMFRNYKNILCVALLTLLSGGLYAQDLSLLNKVYDQLASSCMEIEYSYSAKVSGSNSLGRGTLLLQGPMWVMEGNGLEMRCDSSTIWVMDKSAKEVVVEPVSSDVSSFANPAVVFSQMQELFVVKSSTTSSDAKSVNYLLHPKSLDDVEYLNLEVVKSTAEISRCVVSMKDGTVVKIKVSSIKPTPLRPVSDFRPQISFDSSWIVTDMR